jgi:hypothetical protein
MLRLLAVKYNHPRPPKPSLPPSVRSYLSLEANEHRMKRLMEWYRDRKTLLEEKRLIDEYLVVEDYHLSYRTEACSYCGREVDFPRLWVDGLPYCKRRCLVLSRHEIVYKQHVPNTDQP